MQKIIIFGGSGFIGRHLMKELGDEYEFIIPSRDPEAILEKIPANAQTVKISYSKYEKLIPFFEEAVGIVNLAGENVSGRWTHEKKREIESSRLKIDRLILRAFEGANHNIKFIIQGSGIGIYGLSRSEMELDETSKLGRHDVLAKISTSHEKFLAPLKEKTRLVYIRTSLVLDKDESALPKMASIFKMNLGGTIGNGKQWNSWIHIKDEVRAIKFLIDSKTASGAFNLTSPNAVRQKEFSKTLGRVLHKPSYLRKPKSVLRFMFGEMADSFLLKGLNIKPKRLLEEGFTFRFNTLEEALNDIYKNSS